MADQTNQNQQALAKQDATSLQRIETVEALSVQFDSSKHIVLAPKTVLSGGLPAGMTLSIREVKADMDDTYWMPDKKIGNSYQKMAGLPKTLLMQLSDAAGLSWLPPTRTDDRAHPHYCEWTASAVKKGLDGSTTPYHDAKCVDLREDAGGGIQGKDFEEMMDNAKAAAEEAKKKNKTPKDLMNQIKQARKFISEICLTKAMNRVVADATGIKRAYLKKDLENKSFIIAKLVPDTRDPDAKRAVLAEAMGATKAMFGQPTPKPDVVDATFEEVNGSPPGDEEPVGDTPPSPAGSESPPAAAASEEPTGTREVIDILKGAWAKGESGGMSKGEFAKLCSDKSGKSSRNSMTAKDAKVVASAVDELLKPPAQDGDEDLPF